MIYTNLLLIGVIICQLLLFVSGLLMIKRLLSSLTKSARSYFEPPAPDRQSGFADTVDLIASRLSAAIVASVKGFLMNLNSQAVRSERAEARQAIQANAPPLLQGLMAFAPGIARKIVKNPGLADLAMQVISNMGAQKGAESNNNGHEPNAGGNPFKL